MALAHIQDTPLLSYKSTEYFQLWKVKTVGTGLNTEFKEMTGRHGKSGLSTVT